MAGNAVASLPVRPVASAVEAASLTAAHFFDHPATYIVHREPISPWLHVSTLLRNSLALLIPALVLASGAGIPLGLRAAKARARGTGSLIWLISILGISLPAFMLSMFLWVVNIQVSREFDLTPLPATGLGFDQHLLLPVLVLAARPFAVLTQVAYVTISGLVTQDFVRTARGKGVAPQAIDRRHVMRNAWIPILTALSTSLRFSLAALPIVEYFYVWPGIGLGLLDAIVAGEKTMAVDMVLALGVVFLTVNLVLEVVYPLLDPRLREEAGQAEHRDGSTLWASISQWVARVVGGWWERAHRRRSLEAPAAAETRPAPAHVPRALAAPTQISPGGRGRWAILLDPTFLVAGAMGVTLVILALFGRQMTTASPYVSHGVMVIDGELGIPPFPPSRLFPWGTDQLGRDMQALILHGARQTLTLALLVVGARLALGVVAGMVAGWWKGGLFDQFVTGVLSVWAAFPITLFAMILILAIGIERGMPTFVLALCFVGWGEIAQYVRSEVIALRGMPFLEGARAVGVPPEDILRRHVLPNLAPSILVLASLEMGAVLLILAELGFLGIFLGGGYRVMLGEAGRMSPVIAFYSDVPEWAALLANIRQWWRSYPWVAWSPALAFSIAILAFNLGGEGLRRVLEKSRVSPARWINRASLAGVALMVGVGAWVFNTTAPLGEYRSQADRFQLGRVLETIEELSGAAYGGRETGTEGARAAADYLAAEMESIGLFPGGERETYLQALAAPRQHLLDLPELRILHDSGEVEGLSYRADFAMFPLGRPPEEPIRGRVIGLAPGPLPEDVGGDPYGLRQFYLEEEIFIVPERMVPYLPGRAMAATLVVPDNPDRLQRRYLYPGSIVLRNFDYPLTSVMYIHPELADRLLAGTGQSWESLRQAAEGLGPGEVVVTGPGAEVELGLHVVMGESLEEKYYNVIGYIAGQGSDVGMDDDVIIVSAYYDGLGLGPEGSLFPGANDNLSAVGVMLELARVLKEGPYAPDKTIVFVAWAGGERMEGFSVFNAMSAKVGFHLLNVEAVLELGGVGGGGGDAIALGSGTSFRLTRLIEAAAGRLGVEVTTRGTDAHFGLPTRLGFGERDALTALISWDGSNELAHLPDDNLSSLEPEKMESLGRVMSLVLTVLSREVEY
jgi:peptide/nickel transport system permease protein